jgi:hypothetical protein
MNSSRPARKGKPIVVTWGPLRVKRAQGSAATSRSAIAP